MSATKSADRAPPTVSKASYLPEDLIIMIIDELADMETYNIEESCFLNKHWYYCVAGYKFRSLNVTTKLNDMNISPHSLKDQLKEGDDLIIDLSRNKMPYEYWKAMDALSDSTDDEKEGDLYNEYCEFDFYIPSLDVHKADILLHDLTIIVPGFEFLNTFTYNMEKTKCHNLHLISTSEEASSVSKEMLLRSACATLHTTNLVVKQTRNYYPRQIIGLPMVTTFSMSFTDDCDWGLLILQDWMDDLMSILPNLEELHITNLKLGDDWVLDYWVLNRGGLPRCVILEDSNHSDIANPESANTRAMILIGKTTNVDLHDMPLRYLATESFRWIWDCYCSCLLSKDPEHEQKCSHPLQVLNASGSDWTDSGSSIEHFRGAWPDLKALNCSNTPIDGDGLRAFIEERKDSLEEVVALSCINVSDEVARWIADNVPKTELDVTGRRGYEGESNYSLLDVDTFFKKC